LYPFDNTGVLKSTYGSFLIPISLFFVPEKLPQEYHELFPSPGVFSGVYPQVIHRFIHRFIHRLYIRYPQVTHRLSTGLSTGLYTGYPQVIHSNVIHRLSTGTEVIHRLSTWCRVHRVKPEVRVVLMVPIDYL